MLRVSGLIACLAMFAVWGTPRAGAQNPPTAIKVGFPEQLFRDVPKELIQTAAKPFQSMLQKTAGLDGTLEIVRDYQTLADGLNNGKIDLAVFHGFEYAWVKHNPNLVPIVVTVPSCGKVQACLVVNSVSKAKSSADLKGACVAVPRGSKAHCQMFLDFMRQKDKVAADDCRPAKVTGLTPEEVLDEVVNGKYEAALVDISAMVSYQLNKPGCFCCLKVLRESDPLPSAVVVYRKGALTPQQTAAVREGLLNCNKTASGRTFTMFWNLKGFADVSADYNNILEKTLTAYPPPPAAAPPPPEKK